MNRPRRQSRKPGKYDDEFIIPAEAAEMYWEANTRKVYRFLTLKDVKTSLKHSTVYILWPGDRKWYLAEVEQLDVRQRTASLRYQETNEEEHVSLDELIREKCIAVVEHLSNNTKLKRGREVPCTDKDAEGAEYESGDEAEEDQLEAQQHHAHGPQSARKAQRLDDEDFDADHDSDAAPMSDDEHLDSDAHVSDDQAPSGSDDESLAAKAKKTGKNKQRQGIQADSRQRSGKLNTPSRGLHMLNRSTAVTSIGPLTGPDTMSPTAGAAAAAAAGSMVFVPTGATGSASSAGAAGNDSVWPGEAQQLLGKRRTTEGSGMPGSEAKRRLSEGEQDGAAAGNESFKKAMLEKLLAKRNMAAGSGTSAGGSAKMGMTKLARGVSGIERRPSGGAAGTSLQRAVSDADVRQKAAGQLAVGLKKAVEEMQDKHKQEQQHQQGQLQQQSEGVQQQDVLMEDAEAGNSHQQQHEQQGADSDHPVAVAADQAADGATGVTEGSAAAADVGLVQLADQSQPPEQQQQQQEQHPESVSKQELQLPQQEQQTAADDELQLPDPQELATTIEQHLYDLCGALNAEYKSKLRSLAFNLRDPQNPDLRGHVLTGEISPDQLVRMSAADLANKDLAEWRKKIEEEHNKAIELDLETAAKYSTAAAWASREEIMRRTQVALLGTLVADDKRTTPEPAPAAVAASRAGNRGSSKKQKQEGEQSGSEAALDSRGEKASSGDEVEDDAGGGTPMRPASEDYEDYAAAGGGLVSADGSRDLAHTAADSAGHDVALGDSARELQLQQSEQLSTPGTAAEGTESSAGGVGLIPTLSLSQGGFAAGSAAGAAPAGLQQVASVTSRAPPTAGGIFAGIDWAAIKKDAVKASQEQQPQSAVKPADDEPYNPDDDEDEQPDNQAGQDTAAASGAAPDSAAAAGPSPAAAGTPHRTESVDPDVPDMLPVVAAPKSSRSSSTGQKWPAPCDVVWSGSFIVPGAGSFSSQVQHLAGMGEVGLMMGPQGTQVEVIGRVALDKFAAFVEELRKSRSRTISLGLVGCAQRAMPVDAAYMQELQRGYRSKDRIGKLALAKEVEGYLVAKSELSARLLKTALLVSPQSQRHLLPRDIDSSHFLLLIVHRKDFITPKSEQAEPVQPPQQQLAAGVDVPSTAPQQQTPGDDMIGRLDPRRRAAGAQQQQQQVVVPGFSAATAATQPSGAVPAAPGSLPPPPGMFPPPPAAPAAGPASTAGMSGLDLGSLSALAAALGLPGGAAPAAGAAPDNGAAVAAGPASGDQSVLLLQPVSGGMPGPPPPPSGPMQPAGQQPFSPAQGPASGGAPAGLLAALQQTGGIPSDGVSQPQQYTVDMRPLQQPAAPVPEQSMTFDLRQSQQQQQQHVPPPSESGLPPPGSTGGAPVIILPPGAAVPAPGTVNIPEGAVFMTQDPVTGALIPVATPQPPPPPPQHVMQPPMQQFPGPPAPPPPPGYGLPEPPQRGYPGPFGMPGREGTEGYKPGVPPPPPPHLAHPPPPPGPRGPAGGPPRPMVRRY